MAYIPPGAIKAYTNIKSIINACFSDKNRDPYVTMSKLNSNITVTIRRDRKKITHSLKISDVDKLKQIYDQLYQMAFRRK